MERVEQKPTMEQLQERQRRLSKIIGQRQQTAEGILGEIGESIDPDTLTLRQARVFAVHDRVLLSISRLQGSQTQVSEQIVGFQEEINQRARDSYRELRRRERDLLSIKRLKERGISTLTQAAVGRLENEVNEFRQSIFADPHIARAIEGIKLEEQRKRQARIEQAAPAVEPTAEVTPQPPVIPPVEAPAVDEDSLVGLEFKSLLDQIPKGKTAVIIVPGNEYGEFERNIKAAGLALGLTVTAEYDRKDGRAYVFWNVTKEEVIPVAPPEVVIDQERVEMIQQAEAELNKWVAMREQVEKELAAGNLSNQSYLNEIDGMIVEAEAKLKALQTPGETIPAAEAVDGKNPFIATLETAENLRLSERKVLAALAGVSEDKPITIEEWAQIAFRDELNSGKIDLETAVNRLSVYKSEAQKRVSGVIIIVKTGKGTKKEKARFYPVLVKAPEQTSNIDAE